MKYALVNDIRKEAEPKETGICPCCDKPVRAYCGPQKVYHWKHINKPDYDHWLETETLWHRQWQNYFPKEYQEVVKKDDKTGEKHIADIYIDNISAVIEIQHSPIAIDEIKARENFYKKMLWIVDLYPYTKNLELLTLTKKGTLDFKYLDNVYMHWKRSSDARYNKLLKEGKRDEARELRLSMESESKQLDEFEAKYYKEPYISHSSFFILVWKHAHKRWHEPTSHVFFDFQEKYIFKVVDSVKCSNAFLVRQYPKKQFLEHYYKRHEDSDGHIERTFFL